MLSGKTIIVTGAGSGIGQACAEIFAADGANVIVNDRNPDEGNAVAEALRAEGHKAIFVQGDVTSEDDVARMVEAAVSTYGRLDGAVNNAGVAMSGFPVGDLALQDWSRVIAINLTGVFLSMKHEINAMTKTGGGAIVNISSADGLIGRPDASDYNASKHGVIGLTKSVSTEFRTTRVRVNSVLPGLTATPLIKSLLDDPSFGPQVAKISERHTIDRFGEPEDIAQACRWLLSDLSGYVNGISLSVDGGYLAR